MSDSKEDLERFNRARDQTRHLIEKFKDGSPPDAFWFAESYLNMELEFTLHFAQSGNVLDTEHLCAVFKYRKPSIPESPAVRSRRQRNSILKSGGGTAAIAPSGTDQQQPVLVKDVKLMKDPEVVVPSEVRLGFVDQVYRPLAHSLYFSGRLGFVTGHRIVNWKRGLVVRATTVEQNEVPRKVVKSASQIVNCISDDTCQNGGKSIESKAVDFLAGLQIIIDDKEVRVSTLEVAQLGFEITDVVIGPFEFSPNSSK